MDLTVGKRNKVVALEKVEDTLTQQVHNDADVPSVVEAITEVYAPIPVLGIVGFQRSQHSQLDARGVPVFLYGADDLDRHQLVLSPICGLHNLTKGTLAKQFDNGVYRSVSSAQLA